MQKLRAEKGITLIALVITIIVMLILVGVSVTVALNGGLFITAKQATGDTQNALDKEQTLASGQIEVDGKVYASYQDYLEGKELVETPTVTFNPETLEIGTPLEETKDKYGWKVQGYNVKTEETGGWRLFYQDSNYTYLISDNYIGSYCPSNYYSSYPNGSYVSTVGQRLNKMLLDNGTFFIENNTNENIRATAWFTDTEADIWKQYKNNDALFAIGCPTLELYHASYGATAESNNTSNFSFEVGEFGYKQLTYITWKSEYNKGIYFSDQDGMWIASPAHCSSARTDKWSTSGLYQEPGYYSFNEYNYDVDSDSWSARPVVCISTSVFNSVYASSLINE